MTIIQLADPEVFEGAPCTTGDPDRFFHDGEGGGEQYAQAQAKKECANCHVQKECLNLALKAEGRSPAVARFGVFGGLGPSERARMAVAP